MKYILIFHANLNYAYLPEHKYEFVIRKSYELTIDTMHGHFPDTKYIFEASGFTIEQIAWKTPDVLEKLKAAIQSGQCEFVGSPYAHPMLPNFPKEDGVWSLEFSNEVYQKYLGIKPVSFWTLSVAGEIMSPDKLRRPDIKTLLAILRHTAALNFSKGNLSGRKSMKRNTAKNQHSITLGLNMIFRVMKKPSIFLLIKYMANQTIH